jgi:hypothetical protein
MRYQLQAHKSHEYFLVSQRSRGIQGKAFSSNWTSMKAFFPTLPQTYASDEELNVHDRIFYVLEAYLPSSISLSQADFLYLNEC